MRAPSAERSGETCAPRGVHRLCKLSSWPAPLCQPLGGSETRPGHFRSQGWADRADPMHAHTAPSCTICQPQSKFQAAAAGCLPPLPFFASFKPKCPPMAPYPAHL